jgi:hypothetical protein
MPARYYSFERALNDGTRIEFFGIDTMAILRGQGAEQIKWLEDKLQAEIFWQLQKEKGNTVIKSNLLWPLIITFMSSLS